MRSVCKLLHYYLSGEWLRKCLAIRRTEEFLRKTEKLLAICKNRKRVAEEDKDVPKEYVDSIINDINWLEYDIKEAKENLRELKGL
jgi:hypothetical protein